MDSQLERLQGDAAGFRAAVNKIFSSRPTTPSGWQRRLMEILVCGAGLYLHYLVVQQNSSALWAVSRDRGNGRRRGRTDAERARRRRTDAEREKLIRHKLQRTLETSTYWSQHFNEENPLAESQGLRLPRDYVESLWIHLPEIYGETIEIAAHAKEFLSSRDKAALADLLVGLQHLGRNHFVFVLPALEWSATWNS
ncbi:MAG: hypothetical protein ACRD1L_03815 [Terriglobales bacterium]